MNRAILLAAMAGNVLGIFLATLIEHFALVRPLLEQCR